MARESFVRAQCHDAPDVAERVLAQLAQLQGNDSFIDVDTDRGAIESIRTDAFHQDQRIGAFRLIRKLGAGGMGVVWLAERVAGFAQTVAIKCLDTTGESRGHERFERERAVLARLDHPNIARIVDGGLEGGVPWYAMEYVDGKTLGRHVAEQDVPLAGRIRLMIDVCDAVHYAHRHLIVHRDLKPDNVLVDGNRQVRLLDFGIAKLLGDTADETQTRAPMTLAYAAPEQIDGGAISVATDEYALGVMLYELACGTRPHQGQSAAHLVRSIADTDPVPPSVATARRTERPMSPGKAIDVDFDTIVMKALSRDPSRRYGSVAALAEDLRCWLDGFPISARPRSFDYRARLWVARNRIAAVSLCLVVLSVLIGSLAAWTQAGIAREEARRANKAAQTAKAVTQALGSMLAAAGPDENGGAELTVREALSLGTSDALRAVDDEPDIRRAVVATLARTHLDLGDVEETIRLATPMLAERTLSTDDDRQLALALAEAHTLRADKANAELWLDRLDAAQQALPITDPIVFDTALARIELLRVGGELLAAQGRLDELLAALRALDPADPMALALALEVRAEVFAAESRWFESIQPLEEAVGLLDAAKASPLTRARLVGQLGRAYRETSQTDRAESLIAESLAWHMRVLGADHPNTFTVRSEHAILLETQQKYDEARTLLEALLADRIRVLGAMHPAVGFTHNQIALIDYKQARYDKAAEHFGMAHTILLQRLGESHRHTVTTLGNQAGALAENGRAAEALPILDRVVDLRRRSKDASLPAALMSRGLAYEALDREADAARDFSEALELERSSPGSDVTGWAWSQTLYGRAQRRLGFADTALPELRAAISWFLASDVGCGPRCAIAHLELSRTLVDLRRDTTEARAAAEKAYVVRAEKLGPDHALTREALEWRNGLVSPAGSSDSMH